MRVGPVQLIALAFDESATNRVRESLEAVHGRGVVRLLDVLYVRRNAAGRLTVQPAGDAPAGDAPPYGAAVRRLVGLDVPHPAAGAPSARARDEAGAVGIPAAEVRAVIDSVPRGSAAALLLVEHAWAGRLAGTVRELGGRILAQGLLTRDAVDLAAPELEAAAAAEHSALQASARRSASVLDALALERQLDDGAPNAGAVTFRAPSAVAAEALRALIRAELLDEADAERALAALADAGVLDGASLDEALEAAAARHTRLDARAEARRGRAAEPELGADVPDPTAPPLATEQPAIELPPPGMLGDPRRRPED
ncbi:MAG TPA: hypothetical protein VFQ38_16740 [Longimicrobiales bacterium]|nr:hypothetical protein [Longimicrobiales bacterium]